MCVTADIFKGCPVPLHVPVSLLFSVHPPFKRSYPSPFFGRPFGVSFSLALFSPVFPPDFYYLVRLFYTPNFFVFSFQVWLYGLSLFPLTAYVHCGRLRPSRNWDLLRVLAVPSFFFFPFHNPFKGLIPISFSPPSSCRLTFFFSQHFPFFFLVLWIARGIFLPFVFCCSFLTPELTITLSLPTD